MAWNNSLRLDLQALGLEKRERATINLASYLTQGGTTDDAPSSTDAAASAETPVAA